jgi:predicted small lipoprotein YifL
MEAPGMYRLIPALLTLLLLVLVVSGCGGKGGGY